MIYFVIFNYQKIKIKKYNREEKNVFIDDRMCIITKSHVIYKWAW